MPPRRYGELLREIRQENITNILFFDTDHLADLDHEEDWTPIEGACLVVFKDGHLEQAYVPPQDVRMQCALRLSPPLILHGVLAARKACAQCAHVSACPR